MGDPEGTDVTGVVERCPDMGGADWTGILTRHDGNDLACVAYHIGAAIDCLVILFPTKGAVVPDPSPEISPSPLHYPACPSPIPLTVAKPAAIAKCSP
jgi:hypothetical protein